MESQCLAHSLLHELLSINQVHEASLLLNSLLANHTPSISISLEFFIHSSLNHSSSQHLTQALSLLSSTSLFPRLIINCLRKQERTIWSRIIHNALDILFLFRTTLYGGDLSLASACINVLQGVLCSASEVSLTASIPLSEALYKWCDWEAVKSASQTWAQCLLDSLKYIFEFDNQSSMDVCVAHKAGIELIVVLLVRGTVRGLSDVYRFVVMEENRHSELNQLIPPIFQIDVVLTSVAVHLLQQGYLKPVIELQREIGWKWSPYSSGCTVTNYYDSVTRLTIVSDIQLLPVDVFSDQSLFQELISRCGFYRLMLTE